MISKNIKIKIMAGILLTSMAISTSNIVFAANPVNRTNNIETNLGALVTNGTISSVQETSIQAALTSSHKGDHGKKEPLVIATVKAASFGSILNATSTKKGVTQYQVFDGTKIISRITNLGRDTTIFPGKNVGDVVTIKLLNGAGTIVAIISVTLKA